MNLSKTAKFIIVTILIIVVIPLIIYFLPYEYIMSNLPYINKLYSNTSLTITTRNGVAKVYVNDKEYGKTPLEIKDLPPKNYQVKLVRDSENESFYEPITLNIELLQATEAVIDIEIAPNNVFHGYYLYYNLAPKIKDKGYLTINTQNITADVLIDDQQLKESPIDTQILTTKEYIAKIVKSGYEELSFPIIIREGYNLNTNVFLMRKPVDIDIVNE